MGLPDVQPMQTAMMEKLQERMSNTIDQFSPEAIMQNWFMFDPKMAGRLQDMFATWPGSALTRHKT